MAETLESEITEEQFKAFIKVRDSGKTNMWDSNAVARLSKHVLDRETIVGIITHWSILANKFPNAETRKRK